MLELKEAQIGKQYTVSAGIPDDPTPWVYVTGVLRSKKARMSSDEFAVFWHIESTMMHHYIAVDLIRDVESVRAPMVW
jgi:hypothetical protein